MKDENSMMFYRLFKNNRKAKQNTMGKTCPDTGRYIAQKFHLTKKMFNTWKPHNVKHERAATELGVVCKRQLACATPILVEQAGAKERAHPRRCFAIKVKKVSRELNEQWVSVL